MTMQRQAPRYAFKFWPQPHLIPSFNAYYPEFTKPTGKPIMGMPVHVGTGKYDKSRITITHGGHGKTVPATAAGIKEVVRSIREQELEQIQEIDRQMAELVAKKQALVRLAWQKGHVVTLNEVKQMAGVKK